jgi:hypothetical protein
MANTGPRSDNNDADDDASLTPSNERSEVLGHDFSQREMVGIEMQLKERAPLLDDWSVFFVALVIRGIYKSVLQRRDIVRRVTIVDPVLQAMLKDDSNSDVIPMPSFEDIVAADSAYARTTKTLRRLLVKRATEDVIIPLHAQTHWSLLYYNAPAKRWYHYDSCGKYHTPYALSFLQYLYREDIIDEAERQEAIRGVLRDPALGYAIHNPPQQQQGWECGFYVLMYIRRIFASGLIPLNASDDAETCVAYLGPFRDICALWVEATLRHLRAAGKK